MKYFITICLLCFYVYAQAQQPNNIIIHNIYFEYAKPDIKKDSYKVLDSLIDIFQKDTTLKIEVGVHCDE